MKRALSTSARRPLSPREGGATFPLKHRLGRALWILVWTGLGAWTPAPLHGWRRGLLILFGARLARTAKVYPGVHIWYPKNLEMGDHACLGPGVRCYCMAPISLGQFALVSQRAHLCTGTHDVDHPDFVLVTRPIRIEENAWVAADAFVGPGVTVHKNAVLGARGVTMNDLQEGMIYAGNPARLLRARRNNG